MKVFCYLPCGYPTMEKSMEIAHLYAEAGCDGIEWCIPPEEAYADPPYIADMLAVARKECSDYKTHFTLIKQFKKNHPNMQIILLLYQEVIKEIGVESIATLCEEVGIDTILSGNLTDLTLRETLMQKGLKIAASINYTLYEKEIELVRNANGFIYMQALPSQMDMEAGRDRSTLAKGISLLRSLGIEREVYCGVGIRSPEDIVFIKKSGGQGFFLGSTLLQYYDDLDTLKKTIMLYKEAAK